MADSTSEKPKEKPSARDLRQYLKNLIDDKSCTKKYVNCCR